MARAFYIRCATALVVGLLAVWLPAVARAASSGAQCTVEIEDTGATDDGPRVSRDGDASWKCEGEVVMRSSYRDVPICLSEGASAIAPLPLIPTDGAKAEAAAPCHSFDGAEEWTRSNERTPRQAPQAPPDALVDPIAPLQSPTSRARTIRARVQDDPAFGFPPSVYRPPRA